ncbi:MAG: hypothetical protein MK411_10595 [SAR202 cluster bacterium]|nr:hypothetical protein [SAR202 cluster bacterium]
MLEMNEISSNEAYYSHGMSHGDIKNATKDNPARIIRYEFVTRQYEGYLDEEGRYCEKLVVEFPKTEKACAS